ncbi:MAG: hypothetical protein VB063_12745 [Bacteroides graminisolvens]|nr:hypothetical protein [Bacteroides graminisolvens]MEA4887537.1 hypothetical protein [Bacteroides graminisolvens]
MKFRKGLLLTIKSVVFGCRDSFMYSLNMQPGKLNWSKEEANNWIIATPL